MTTLSRKPKAEYINRLEDVINNILDRQPERLIPTSEAGFVTFEYILKNRMPLADRIWDISEEPLVIACTTRKAGIDGDILNLFPSEEALEQDTQRKSPQIVHMFTQSNTTAAGLLNSWKSIIKETTREEDACGTVVGLSLADCGSYARLLPGMTDVRYLILQIGRTIEGYAKPVMHQNREQDLCKLMGASGAYVYSEGLYQRIATNVADPHYFMLQDMGFTGLVDEIVERQKQAGKPFHFKIENVPVPVKAVRRDMSLVLP